MVNAYEYRYAAVYGYWEDSGIQKEMLQKNDVNRMVSEGSDEVCT